MTVRHRIGIVGAGVGGIALAVKLKRAGFDDFTIFEKSQGPGGTWWDNVYPGAACDVSALLYSFSFMAYDWSGTHPTQAEIFGYVEAVIDRFGLRPHIRFGTPVRQVVWDEVRQCYDLHTENDESHVFDVVVSAVGMLNVPNYPHWPGLESFGGPKFHTARWEQHDLRGKRVAVVGTGSTTAQLVPAIAPDVGRLFVYQREPGWVAPKDERLFDASERQAFRNSALRRTYARLKLFWSFERLRSSSDPNSQGQKKLREACERHVENCILDPALRALVTPKHDVFCKRPILSNSYLPALARDNVELVPHAVTAVTPRGLIDASGAEREVDVLIMATGFRAADYLATLDVVGRGGARLHDVWAGDPAAFLGLAVPGFPNFYMLYGPGTNGGSIIFKLERQAEWIVRVVRRMRRSSASAIEVRPVAYQRFNRWLGDANAKMAWNGGCNNYFTSASGRIVTQWPGSMGSYWLMARLLNRVAMRAYRLAPQAAGRAGAVPSMDEGRPVAAERR